MSNGTEHVDKRSEFFVNSNELYWGQEAASAQIVIGDIQGHRVHLF